MDRSGRERIERAALELFAEQGVEGATTRDIARRAGLAEGTLYRHFATKEELAHSMFLEVSGRLTRRLDQAERNVRGFVDAFFRFAAEEPEAYEFVIHRHPRRLPEGRRLPKDVALEVVRGSPLDPMLAVAILVGMIVRAIFFLRQGLLRDSPEEVARQVADAARRALRCED
jgi:AcrR family transcriptional regulator